MTSTLRSRVALILASIQLFIAFCPYPVFADDLTCITSPFTAEAPFADVTSEDVWFDALRALKDAGIVTGYPDGSFAPERNITRQELAFLMSRTFDSCRTTTSILLRMNAQDPISVEDAVKLLLIEKGVSRRIATESLPDTPGIDKSKFSGRAGDGFLYAAYFYGILDHEKDAAIDPTAFLTRGDAAVLLARVQCLTDLSFDLPEAMYGIPVSFEGENAKTFVHDVASALSCFPDTVLTSYASSGGTITVTDTDSDSYYQTDTEVNGMFWPQNNQILLFSHGNRSSLLHSVEGTARHELGHFMYDELVSDADLLSLKRLFKTDELKRFIRTTGRTGARDSSGEYFAELISYMAFYGWNEACDAFPESAAIAAYYLELERPCETLPAA